MIETEAWVLYEQSKDNPEQRKAVLRKELFSFPDLTEEEVLVEPVYGCWEGNMGHAVERKPVDICQLRKEEKVVIGNAGVVKAVRKGSRASEIKTGQYYVVFGASRKTKRFGQMVYAYAYDEPGSIGLMAKQTKLHKSQLFPIPENSRASLQQWAGFSLRYFTGWSNWKVAHGTYRLMVDESEYKSPYAWGWGGGVTYAMLDAARIYGYEPVMVSSKDSRLEMIKSKGIRPVDRKFFPDLNFDEKKYNLDVEYRERYLASEKQFLNVVREITGGENASLFIDLIGEPVMRATLKALACPGVLTTLGWKEGMKNSSVRAIECMNWHVHVHTHGALHKDALEAVEFAERHNWFPPAGEKEYGWDEIPQLADDFTSDSMDSMFPVYRV